MPKTNIRIIISKRHSKEIETFQKQLEMQGTKAKHFRDFLMKQAKKIMRLHEKQMDVSFNYVWQKLPLIDNQNWQEQDYIQALEHLSNKREANKEKLSLFKNKFDRSITKQDIKIYYKKVFEKSVVKAYFGRFDKKRKNKIKFLEWLSRQDSRVIKKLMTLMEHFPKGWDFSPAFLKNASIRKILKIEETLSKYSFIKKIAEILGKSKNKYDDNLSEKQIQINKQAKSEYDSPTSTEGIKQGSNIANILPYQFGLRKNKMLSNIFKKNLLENKLLEFDRKDELLQDKTIDEHENEDKRGPIILVIDTSGSMHGTPEEISKAISLAIARIASTEKRKCFIMTFSTVVKTLEINSSQININRFYNFLSKSFSGGTDLWVAILDVLEKIKEEEYKKADVLFISDFVIDELSDEEISKIKESKNENNKFYALAIQSWDEEIEEDELFTHTWTYKIHENNIDELERTFDKFK